SPSAGHEPGHDAEAEHATEHHHHHEPAIMIAPLVILAIGAVIAGYFGGFLKRFLERSPSIAPFVDVEKASAGPASEATRSLHLYLMILSGAVALAGVWLAYRLHLKDRSTAERLAQRYPDVVDVLDHK